MKFLVRISPYFDRRWRRSFLMMRNMGQGTRPARFWVSLTWEYWISKFLYSKRLIFRSKSRELRICSCLWWPLCEETMQLECERNLTWSIVVNFTKVSCVAFMMRFPLGWVKCEMDSGGQSSSLLLHPPPQHRFPTGGKKSCLFLIQLIRTLVVLNMFACAVVQL